AQGHSVFMVSWVNPDESLAEYEFGHYATRGVIPALERIEELTGEQHVNAIGYCVGGMLLSTAAAYMVSKRMKQRIKSMTLLTTMLEFSDPGEIGVFINEPTISAIESQNKIRGYMDGRLIESTFSLLRENSLFWNYYVKNYLKGESPLDFDLLYWNSDSTNIAAACHNDILRKLYLNDLLKEPKGIEVDGIGIDLSKIKMPVYFLSAKDDHIAGWESTFAGSQHLKGKVTFVLGESGHIAGVINPPAKNKYGYWAGGDINAQDAKTWVKSAEHHTGSWWPHWQQWSEQQNTADFVPAREVSKEASLTAAPGTYVLQKLPLESAMEEAS
ncbi:class I poly(R)-hydroxyalkanoic acid synthase, partial [Marinomonas sp. 42_23_T18]